MKKHIILLTLAAFLLAGCAPLRKAPPRTVEKVVKVMPTPMPAPAVLEAPGVPEEKAALTSLTERMIIRKAELKLVVQDTKKAITQVESMAKEMGGYVSQSNAWKEEDQLRATLVIMVPAERFEEALAHLRDMSVDVLRESVSGQDVTEEYTDLSARLKNLEATEKELRELLTTVRERTGKAEDILAVYRELTKIRGQIEQVKGRMQYLEQMTAFSTITVELIPNVLAQPVTATRWQPLRVLWQASRALVRALQALITLLIWLVVFGLPLLLIIGLPPVAIWWGWRRWRRKRATPGSPERQA